MSQTEMPRHIFRAYDIRGKIDEDITPDRVHAIARAFATHFLPEHPKVVLGRDLRDSSRELADAARKALIEAGAQVWDAGVVPSPLAYFAMGRWGADGGVVVTASHLPPDHNGMKVRLGDQPFYGDQLQKLYAATLEPPKTPGGGTVTERDPYGEYFPVATKYLHLDRPVHAVLDLGNGAGILTGPKLLGELGVKLDVIFGEADGGKFHGRGPDPTKPGALDALSKRVVETGAEIGLAIDADGDRVAVVDEKGEVISADRALMPLFRATLADGPATFVTEVRCTRSTIRDVEAHGGKLVMTKCGYPFILAKMHELNAAMGFETTGHYYFHNPDIKFDDAIFAAGLLLGALGRSQERIGEIVASAPAFYTSDELRWECSDETKFKVVERLTEEFRKEYDVVDEDGVRVERKDGWALVRASNTAEQLTMRWEGDSPESRDAIGEELKTHVRRVMDEMCG